MDQKKLRSILAAYDDYYTALYRDRNNPQQPDEHQLLQGMGPRPIATLLNTSTTWRAGY
jgi:hypothetical protein